MKYILPAALALMVGGCAAMKPKPVTFAPKCEKNLRIEGTEKVDRLHYMARLACMDLEQATERKLHRMPPMRLRVYGAGDKPELCENRSGTCTAAHANGSYTIEVRKPTLEEVRDGDSVEASALHEFRHVALFELKPELCENTKGDECNEKHHKEMFKLNVCQPEKCGMDIPAFKIFGD